MSVDLKALGVLFRFRFINDVEDMELGVLQEMYAAIEEEYQGMNNDRKELKKELVKLNEVIERKNPEERREKIKKKLESDKVILHNEDVPYEIRMKYIIDAYRKDQKKWGKLVDYAKHLEGEVMRLKEILIANGYTGSGVVGDSKPGKVINELQMKVTELKKKLKEKNAPVERIKFLEKRIAETYPKRVHALSSYKKVIKSQEDYIKALQKLLDENGIKYHEKCPINDIEADGADAINEYAVSD